MASGTVTCTTPVLQPGSSPMVTIYVGTKAPGFVTNTVTATYAGAAAPLTASREFVVGGGPLQFTYISAPPAAKAGSDENFNITLTNTGAVPTTGTFELDLPAGATFVGTTAPGISCTGIGGPTVSCALPTLAAGAKLDLPMLTRLPATAGVATYNIALRLPVYGRVTTLPQPIVVTARNVQLTTEVLLKNQIVTPGTDTVITLRVKNLGADQSTPISVSAQISPSLVVRSIAAAGGSCVAPPAVGCSGIVLAGGASADVTFIARAVVTPTITTATVTATATSSTASAPSVEAQVLIAQNTQTTTTTALAADRNTASPGNPLTYKASVLNTGAGSAYTLKTQFVLSAGGSITSAVGDGFTCTQQQPYAVTCETPLLPAGATGVVTLDVVAPPDPVSAVVLTATTTALNTPSQTVLISTPIGGSLRDVAVAVQESAGTAVAGQRIPIHFDVTNPSTKDAGNVTLDASLTPGLILDSIATTAGSCVATHCALGTLKAGAKETVTATVIAASVGAQSVHAAIACDSQESTADDDTASLSINVAAARSRGVRH